MSRLIFKTPLRVKTTTTHKTCGEVVKKRFGRLYSCPKCNCWTDEVTHKQEPHSIINTATS